MYILYTGTCTDSIKQSIIKRYIFQKSSVHPVILDISLYPYILDISLYPYVLDISLQPYILDISLQPYTIYPYRINQRGSKCNLLVINDQLLMIMQYKIFQKSSALHVILHIEYTVGRAGERGSKCNAFPPTGQLLMTNMQRYMFQNSPAHPLKWGRGAGASYHCRCSSGTSESVCSCRCCGIEPDSSGTIINDVV